MATFVPEGNEESLVFLRDRAISEVRGFSLPDLCFGALRAALASLRSGGCPQAAGKPRPHTPPGRTCVALERLTYGERWAQDLGFALACPQEG